jgi:hypothetical protein
MVKVVGDVYFSSRLSCGTLAMYDGGGSMAENKLKKVQTPNLSLLPHRSLLCNLVYTALIIP